MTDTRIQKMIAASIENYDSSKEYKVFLKGVRKKIMITNATNNQTVVYVYEMMAKHDRATNIESDAVNADTKLAVGDSKPFQDSNVMYVPTTAPLVYQHWRKMGRTHYRVMDPGAVWIIEVNVPIRKYFNTSRLISNEVISDPRALRGLTTQTLIRFHGTPASRTDAEGDVTITNARLECCVNEIYTYKAVANSQQKTELENDYLQTGGFDIINDESGLLDTVVNAG
jgi:hypothetical protein